MRRSVCVVVCSIVLAMYAGCVEPETMPDPGTTPSFATEEGYVESTDGVRLFYRLIGTGPDTVVILHGGPGFTMDYLLNDLEPLADHHALLFYDQRGAGRSTLVTDSAALAGPRFVEDLEAIRRDFGIERLLLLGHSWGAGVVALYAQAHPERIERLIIVGGIPLQQSGLVEAFRELDAARDSLSRRRLEEAREARLADPGDADACRAYYVIWFDPFFGDRTAVTRSRGDFCAGTPDALRNKMSSVDRFTMASLGQWDWRSTLRDVAAPALVVHGTVDPLPVEAGWEWAEALPNARILLLDGIGHFSYLEAAETFFAAVKQFLRGEWPEGARTASRQ